jgi:hypothetical protein
VAQGRRVTSTASKPTGHLHGYTDDDRDRLRVRAGALAQWVHLVALLAACAPTGSTVVPTEPRAEHRDGKNDFAFEIGTWKTRIARLERPLTGSTSWVHYEGTTDVRPIWQGAASLVELAVEGPAGRIEGVSLRLYDPTSRRWSLHFASRRSGVMSPPTIGRFRNGRGEFYGREEFDGKPILVRFIISDITATSCRFEQAFSGDDGKTWEVNWIAIDTR